MKTLEQSKQLYFLIHIVFYDSVLLRYIVFLVFFVWAKVLWHHDKHIYRSLPKMHVLLIYLLLQFSFMQMFVKKWKSKSYNILKAFFILHTCSNVFFLHDQHYYETGAATWMLANLKIICRFHIHPVHQNSQCRYF
jgi:hypothetical protein